MQGFKIIHSETGTRYTVNLSRIDAIVYRQDKSATVHVGTVKIEISAQTATELESVLGALA